VALLDSLGSPDAVLETPNSGLSKQPYTFAYIALVTLAMSQLRNLPGLFNLRILSAWRLLYCVPSMVSRNCCAALGLNQHSRLLHHGQHEVIGRSSFDGLLAIGMPRASNLMSPPVELAGFHVLHCGVH